MIKGLGIGQNRDDHIQMDLFYPRTSQTMTVPSTAVATPLMRKMPSGDSRALAARRLAKLGKAAKSSPSITSTRPIPTTKSDIQGSFRRGHFASSVLGLPVGFMKNRKNSESELSNMRVSLLRNPAS